MVQVEYSLFFVRFYGLRQTAVVSMNFISKIRLPSKRTGIAVACVFAILLVLVSFCAHWAYSPVFISGKPVPFEIAKGGTAKSVIAQINEQDVALSDPLFVLLVRITGNSSSLMAGPYELKAGETPVRLLQKITRGIFALESVTIIEGFNFRQMRRTIARNEGLKHDTVDLSDAEILRRLGIRHHSGEGLFYPDTYMFKKGASDMQIYRRAYETQMERLNALWAKRDLSLPYKTPYEALIMASLIEKETASPDDRDKIAGVFLNRLRIGMKLQTDPTVIYGMGLGYRGKIRKLDLLTDNPYNTYTRYGMPPTPIAMPGEEAMEAAFNPAATDALYFVAKGDGSSQFSSNLRDHNEAVRKFILKK